MVDRYRRHLVGATAFAGFAVPAKAIQAACEAPMASAEVLRRLKSRVTLHNPSATEIPDVVFRCYLPMKTVGQSLVKLDVTSPHEVTEDAMGHQILSVNIGRLAPYGSAAMDLSIHVAKAVGGCANVGDTSSWTQPERYIESSAPEILSLAGRLRGANEAETAQMTYRWVKDQLQYEGYVAQDRGALYAVKAKSGDCTEYAALLVALARANGIPARMLGGYVAEHDAVLKAVEYHNWAELYLDARWQIVDPQKGRWSPSSLTYVPFEIYREWNVNEMDGAHRFRATAGVDVGP